MNGGLSLFGQELVHFVLVCFVKSHVNVINVKCLCKWGSNAYGNYDTNICFLLIVH